MDADRELSDSIRDNITTLCSRSTSLLNDPEQAQTALLMSAAATALLKAMTEAMTAELNQAVYEAEVQMAELEQVIGTGSIN